MKMMMISARRTPVRRVLLPVLVAIVGILMVTGGAYAKGNKENGKKIYDRKCAWCHGWEGAGDGPAKDVLNPAPRDFTSGIFKYKTSDREETFPFDQDLFKMIKDGMPGTGMPNWSDVLKEDEMWDLVAYIKTFGGLEAEPKKKVELGKKVASDEKSVAAGKKLFEDRCYECHGTAGVGNSMKKLKDDWIGRRLWARNLTKPATYRAGSTVEDIYTRITTGIPGTAMPSFADPTSTKKLTDEERWQVANYVVSIQSETKRVKDGDTVLKGTLVNGALPKDATDPAWKNAPSTSWFMVGNIVVGDRNFMPTNDVVVGRALYNKDEIAILLEWDDRTRSVPGDAKAIELADGDFFQDSIAIQVPQKLMESEKPYFIMGDSSKPVNFLQWSSGTTEEPQNLKVFDATGIDKATAREATGFTAVGAWDNGTWRVMFKRPIKTKDEKDLQLEQGVYIPFALNAWDGHNGETGSKRTITTWYWLYLMQPAGSGPIIGATIWAGVVLALLLLLSYTMGKSYKKE